MPNVLIDKDKLDVLANAISAKSGEALTLTLDEMVDAVDGIETGGGGGGTPTLETITTTYTVTTSTQTDTITPSAGYDGIDEVDVTINAIPTGSAGTPSASKGAVSNHSITVTPSVTNSTGYINGGTLTGSAVTVSASELVSGTLSITSAGTSDVTTYASATVATGGATASASKGTVTNHSITVTPMVTRTAGYVTAGTANGTAVTVSASELVSGSETKTTNGTYDVTNLASLVVNVSGGGSGIGDLLATTAIGAYSTTSTQATNMNMNIAATNVNGYDVLLVETSVDTEVANRHTATVGVAFITNSTNVSTKNAAVMANAKWNAKLSSTSVTQTTSSTTAYGIYPNSCTVTTTSNGTATFAMYARYNSTRSGTINGTYTARVYGIKLCDLIGG